MAGGDGTIEGLKGRINEIINAVEGIESALRLVEDRTDGALVATSNATEESASLDVLAALASFAKIKQEIEGQAGAALAAKEALERYRDGR